MDQVVAEQIKSQPDFRHQVAQKQTATLDHIAKLSLVHLQLTARCNLRCSFCGQWGDGGYFHDKSSAVELTTQEWLRIIDETVALADGTPVEFILWGGEPLLSASFEHIAAYISAVGCKAALVTNGTLLKQHIATINSYITTLYVSIDGPKAVHEQIRNAPGIFATIKAGLEEIDHNRVKTVCMTTICESNVAVIEQMPFMVAKLGFDKLILQNLIYCSSDMAEDYANWLHCSYQQPAPQIKTWVNDQFGIWTEQVAVMLKELNNNIANRLYPLPVMLYPKELSECNILDWFEPNVQLQSDNSYCKMPFAHLQITATGEVNFCVDFCDFSLGNVKQLALKALWLGDNAQKFRKDIINGDNPLCQRCPWFYNSELKTD